MLFNFVDMSSHEQEITCYQYGLKMYITEDFLRTSLQH